MCPVDIVDIVKDMGHMPGNPLKVLQEHLPINALKASALELRIIKGQKKNLFKTVKVILCQSLSPV